MRLRLQVKRLRLLCGWVGTGNAGRTREGRFCAVFAYKYDSCPIFDTMLNCGRRFCAVFAVLVVALVFFREFAIVAVHDRDGCGCRGLLRSASGSVVVSP